MARFKEERSHRNWNGQKKGETIGKDRKGNGVQILEGFIGQGEDFTLKKIIGKYYRMLNIRMTLHNFIYILKDDSRSTKLK